MQILGKGPLELFEVVAFEYQSLNQEDNKIRSLGCKYLLKNYWKKLEELNIGKFLLIEKTTFF